MMGATSLFVEGTLQGRSLDSGEGATGTNAQAVSVAGGVVWVSDQAGGTLMCIDPTSSRIRDRVVIDAPDLNGRIVVQVGSPLYMDGSRYLLRLDPPSPCRSSG